METKYLDGEKLYHCFVSGAREVIRNRKDLNDTNVFPVADGDTGNNLASTMNSIIIQSRVTPSAGNTMNSIADAALTGARGNSGIIMAQYINGIYLGIQNEDQVSMSSFAESVTNAVPHAYHAIQTPVEGTIITVIREWAETVYRLKDSAHDFNELLTLPLERAYTVLKETTSMLKVLERSKVVDSGAKGFFHFVQGFTEFIRTGHISEPVELTEELNSEAEIMDSEPSFRYCTEALIVTDSVMDLDSIRDELGGLGDSLIVAGNPKKARIHIHSDHPELVMDKLRRRGSIIQQKADDMRRQYESSFTRRHEIALVTDSIADLPAELLDRYQIHMIPLNIMVGESSYLDKITMTPELFYDLAEELETYPSSAQPSPKVVESLYQTLLNHYDQILVITVASVQSGTFSVFEKAAQTMQTPGKRIVVMDSKQNSGAEGLLVLKAAELIEAGKTMDEIIPVIEALRRKTRILVSVNTLKYMVRSGRLSKLSGLAGKVMNLKPVISLDDTGKGMIEAKAFSTRSNTHKILNIVAKANQGEGITRYAIVHADDEPRAQDLKEKMVQLLQREPEYIMNISTIVGMSAGQGSVAVAYLSEDHHG
ncbi:DegV family protein [Proteiniclasticum sp. QWL-01]|uniref:DAK2 domain-containing protein n=1 Tax=Proteiniclasticum sp. QWL-01 TaxID=3036945 RepID=UPI002411677E|nr:DegV family protein [Proteiniclasticum sp. QWL-01]WFF73826.1 DegV family protein [Proteiniclasticum sp. QWL-01]